MMQMSLKYFTHATPTLFNAGTPRHNLVLVILSPWNPIVYRVFIILSQIAQKYQSGQGVLECISIIFVVVTVESVEPMGKATVLFLC